MPNMPGKSFDLPGEVVDWPAVGTGRGDYTCYTPPSMGIVARALRYPAYLLEAAMHPRRMCAIAPTSAVVLQEVCREIRGPLERFINIGAGTGDLEAMLLEQGKIVPNGRMIAVEPSGILSLLIRPMADFDPRVQVVRSMFHEARADIRQRLLAHGGLAQEIATSVPLSKFSPQDLQAFLQESYDLSEPDAGFTAFIVRDVSDEIRKVYPYVSVKEAPGHWLPPMKYRIHRALKKKPSLRVYDPALTESPHVPAPAMVPEEFGTDAPSPA